MDEQDIIELLMQQKLRELGVNFDYKVSEYRDWIRVEYLGDELDIRLEIITYDNYELADTISKHIDITLSDRIHVEDNVFYVPDTFWKLGKEEVHTY